MPDIQRTTRRILTGFTLAAALVGFAAPVSAALDVNDTSIINLYRFDEKTSGQLNNNDDPAFTDTAPTGTAQNHVPFGSPGPDYGSGAAFQQGAVTVGTGTGLIFDRSNGEHTRFASPIDTSQGNYTNGDSYTVMVRLRVENLGDGTPYDVLGNNAHGISLEGVSFGGGTVQARVRGGSGGPVWTANSGFGPVFVPNGAWVNLFVIYEQNTSITIAVDNGSSFETYVDANVPGGFDSSTGFEDSANTWQVGARTAGVGTNSLDGRIESIVFWDKALSTTEADAIDLANVPEPATLGLMGLGAVLMLRRR